MRSSWIIGSCGFVAAHLFGYAYASPLNGSPADLVSRSRGGSGNAGKDQGIWVDEGSTKRQGWIHCFVTGSWIYQDDIRNVWDNACVGTGASFTKAGFNYPMATRQPGQGLFDTVIVSPDQSHLTLEANSKGGNPQEATIQFQGKWMSPNHNTYDDCTWALSKVIGGCYGDNADTQGGWFEFADDWSKGKTGTTYMVDVGPLNNKDQTLEE
ncbi:MAG: hypothetical protein M1812_002464 [Candelaria pacifica]|nr:MAG: hypothetical protein M1812_002464 [Candelaria pacifica]